MPKAKFKCVTCEEQKKPKFTFMSFDDAVAHISLSENNAHRIQDLSLPLRQTPRVTPQVVLDPKSEEIKDSDEEGFNRQVLRGEIPQANVLRKVNHPREDEE